MWIKDQSLRLKGLKTNRTANSLMEEIIKTQSDHGLYQKGFLFPVSSFISNYDPKQFFIVLPDPLIVAQEVPKG